MRIIFVTGASGSGKTTLVRNIENKTDTGFGFYYFDNIGVPSIDDMITQYGSGDEWRRQTTTLWIDKILQENNHDIAVLDGQMRVAFITEACRNVALNDYGIVLVDCNNEERKARLIRRGQAELASDDMMAWAAYLRNEAKSMGATILDTSALSVQESESLLLSALRK